MTPKFDNIFRILVENINNNLSDNSAEQQSQTPQQQQVRNAIAKGMQKKTQMARAEYTSQPTKTHWFDPQGRYSDQLIGIEEIQPDGTVVVAIGDVGKSAMEAVRKLAALGGLPGVKVIQKQPTKTY